MSTIKRGIKNIFRNKSRNIAVLLILTLALSLSLMMINMDFSSNQKVKEIEKKYENIIGVGISKDHVKNIVDKKKESYGIGTLLWDENLADDILKLDSVKSVDKSLFEGFSSEKLIARSLVESYDKNTIIGVYEKFDNFIRVYSINERQRQDLKLVEGSLFRETDIDQNVALIEKNFAERNNLEVGSKIIIKGEKIRVCGIYEYKFIEFNSIIGVTEPIFAPLKTVQRLFDLEGKISSFLYVTVDSADNVHKVVDYIREIGNGALEAQPVMEHTFFHFSNMIKRISKVSVMSSLIVAITIILSVMFINVRERAKEIGILKAIGASNLNISAQFLIESLTICAIALILSIVIILIANQAIADFIIEREKSSMELGDYIYYSEEMQEEDKERLREVYSLEEEPDEFIKSKRLKITFTTQILIYAILLTFLLGAIGSIIPAYYISKLRPAEVLRFE